MSVRPGSSGPAVAIPPEDAGAHGATTRQSTKGRHMDINIVLLAPEIPHNTGAIGRVCVGLDAHLHLVRPLGFALTQTRLRRAGLDYWEHVHLTVHDNWKRFLEQERPQRLFFASTRGTRSYLDYRFSAGDYLVFGNETGGLSADLYARYADALYRIPMPGPHARSINLANAVAIVVYEAYRQLASQQAPERTSPRHTEGCQS